MIAGAPIPIDSRVSRTCLPIEVLGDAAYTLNAKHLSSVKVRIYPRAQVPGDSCRRIGIVAQVGRCQHR